MNAVHYALAGLNAAIAIVGAVYVCAALWQHHHRRSRGCRWWWWKR